MLQIVLILKKLRLKTILYSESNGKSTNRRYLEYALEVTWNCTQNKNGGTPKTALCRRLLANRCLWPQEELDEIEISFRHTFRPLTIRYLLGLLQDIARGPRRQLRNHDKEFIKFIINIYGTPIVQTKTKKKRKTELLKIERKLLKSIQNYLMLNFQSLEIASVWLKQHSTADL